MIFGEFMRLQPPAYGTAPVGLIAEYQAILSRIEAAHKDEAGLAPDAMAELREQATALAGEISKYRQH
ncbi:hypothetical protein ACH6CV_17060 [Bacillota bacterium Meth-B3]|nr:hypothetical protein [Christensenellaceae bacterium]MEA5066531.1 hypothetical protein [Eubacteriales bacterium]MEA5069005.1 hypothetical protein [Christensenellaceae bacterium]